MLPDITPVSKVFPMKIPERTVVYPPNFIQFVPFLGVMMLLANETNKTSLTQQPTSYCSVGSNKRFIITLGVPLPVAII
jgi:hypothetical protein